MTTIPALIILAAAHLQLPAGEPGEASSPALDTPVVEAFEVQGFRTTIEVLIDAPVETVFGAATGEVGGWWDHSFWPDPGELVIEPRMGGRFYERPAAGSDDGALHAEVIFVRAPHQLRLHGPLGLSGRAFDLVTSWTLEPAESADGTSNGATSFRVDLNMAGDIDAEMAGVVRSVWVHFIGARLKPWVEGGCHLEPEAPCAAFETASGEAE